MPNIEDFIPHRGKLRLIDILETVCETKGTASTTVSNKWPFISDNAVDSILCIELIAQTASALVGFKRNRGAEGGMGYLVGVDSATFYTRTLTIGNQLKIEVEKIYDRGYYGIFSGKVILDSNIIAEAQIKAIEPIDQYKKQ